MNRRSFFSSVGALIGAASLSPNIFIPKLDPVKWKVGKRITNPEWFAAQYECYFIDAPPVYDERIFHRCETELLVPDRASIITVDRGAADIETWTWDETK
jgi:hypothetical protein